METNLNEVKKHFNLLTNELTKFHLFFGVIVAGLVNLLGQPL